MYVLFQNIQGTADEVMDTHKSSVPVTFTNYNSVTKQPDTNHCLSLHHQQEGSEKQAINSHTSPITNTRSVAEITPPSHVSRSIAQNILHKSTAAMISLPQIHQRTTNTASNSQNTVASPLRYKLSVPMLSIPPRASNSSVAGTKPSSPSISQPSKLPPQIPMIQRYSQHTTVSSPLSVTTVAKNNSIQQSAKSTILIPQLTIQTPGRLFSSITVPNQPRVRSLPKPVSSFLQTPLANSAKPAHGVTVTTQVHSLNDTHQVKPADISIAPGRNVGKNIAQSTASVSSESHVISLENPNSIASNLEGQPQQTEPVDYTQAMDTETSPVGAAVSTQQQSMEHSRTREAERRIDETSTFPQQHAMDVNTGHGTNIAGHEAAATPHTEMEQLPNMNTLFSLQSVGDDTSTNNMTVDTQGSLYTEPNSNATVGDHGYVQHGECTEMGSGNEVFQNQAAFAEDQMMVSAKNTIK